MMSLPFLFLLVIITGAKQLYFDVINNCKMPIMLELRFLSNGPVTYMNMSLRIGQHQLFVPPTVHPTRVLAFHHLRSHVPTEQWTFAQFYINNADYNTDTVFLGGYSVNAMVKSDSGFRKFSGQNQYNSNILFYNTSILDPNYAEGIVLSGDGYTLTFCP